MLFAVTILLSLLETVSACVPTNPGLHDSVVSSSLAAPAVRNANRLRATTVEPSRCRRCKSEDITIDTGSLSVSTVASKSPIRLDANNCSVMTLICNPARSTDVGFMVIEINQLYLHEPSPTPMDTTDVFCDTDGTWSQPFRFTLYTATIQVSSFRCNLQSFGTVVTVFEPVLIG
ncbi:unnamed protein product [Auanema sp. JU1783]|nr:unnamed protein product [Auanema sp. JU1783]